MLNLVGLILESLSGNSEPIPHLFEQPYKFIRRYRKWEKRHYLSTVSQMKKRELIKVTNKNGEKFIESTKKGQIELLIKKAILPKAKVWDGCWRLIIFDIPESSRDKRNKLRWLLKKNNFIKLQASVFINPNPLNPEAISFLKESGLYQFIRILKVLKIDNDLNLRKKFKLS